MRINLKAKNMLIENDGCPFFKKVDKLKTFHDILPPTAVWSFS
jgi:hypothetical protein